MKGILIVDLPDGAIADDINILYRLDSMSKFRELFYPEEERWNIGTLKHMPQERDIFEQGYDEEDTRDISQWNKGFNACIEEILKMEENE